MNVRPAHLRHPLRAAGSIRSLIADLHAERRFAERGRRRFEDDPRYDLRSVTAGFADRLEDEGDDTELLQRICTAYIKASVQEQSVSAAWQATEWWKQQRNGSLRPVITALLSRDIPALRGMYRNFYRDPCSAGLILLQRRAARLLRGTVAKTHQRSYMADTLYFVDYWRELTGDRYAVRELAGPVTGNPFGAMVEETLVRAGSEYQHYCACRVRGLQGSGAARVAEIGGGFGGMAFYLLRDRPQTVYIDFDVPESIALTSWYLLRSLPHLSFLLYGEAELTEQALQTADVVLMPVFEMPKMPRGSVEVTFSSHTMADLSPEATAEYLEHIGGMTKDAFLSISHDRAGDGMDDLILRRHRGFHAEPPAATCWHRHRVAGSGELERLYRVRGSHADA